jgi:alkylated DNA repair dioxygenase AlkB
MTDDLFSDTDHFQKIPMPDADVFYLHNLELSLSYDALLKKLISETPWQQKSVLVWAKEFQQPRLIAWYGDPGRNYSYSGILNYYRDNRDSMGFHSDDEPALGDRPIIASLSLGEERTFVMKHKTDRYVKPIRLRLASGSVLLMKGNTQRFWQHGIAKATRRCGPRLNLTFRTIVPVAA